MVLKGDKAIKGYEGLVGIIGFYNALKDLDDLGTTSVLHGCIGCRPPLKQALKSLFGTKPRKNFIVAHRCEHQCAGSSLRLNYGIV